MLCPFSHGICPISNHLHGTLWDSHTRAKAAPEVTPAEGSSVWAKGGPFVKWLLKQQIELNKSQQSINV